MAHLDVYRNPDRTTSALIPYVLDVQSSLLDSLPGSVVIPLARPETIGTLPILRLNPTVSVDGKALVALTQDLATCAAPTSLKNPSPTCPPSAMKSLPRWIFLFTGF
jgi:hypothetical protein